jgi:hypothetical protein
LLLCDCFLQNCRRLVLCRNVICAVCPIFPCKGPLNHFFTFIILNIIYTVYLCNTSIMIRLIIISDTFLARLCELYGELSYSPWRRRRRPRPDFRLKFRCSKIFFTITLSFSLGINFKLLIYVSYHQPHLMRQGS